MHVCVPKATSGVVLTPYDWLNKFYSCYMVTVAVIINVSDFRPTKFASVL